MMTEARLQDIPSVDTLINKAKDAFVTRFSEVPTAGAYAPGRVNIIGEHTDYNEGFVLPMALPLATVITGRNNSCGKCRVLTLAQDAENNYVEFEIPSNRAEMEPGDIHWATYIRGVIARHKGGNVVPFDAVVVSSVPYGSGLSSSASVQVATYLLLDQLNPSEGQDVSKKEKIKACLEAEQMYAGLPCGIMDQYISVMGKQDKALLIDCSSIGHLSIPMNDPELAVLITNSNVQHQLTGTEYPTRQRQCYRGAEIMQKKTLRDASLEELEERYRCMNPQMFKRVRHVLSENNRTVRAAEALNNRNYHALGALMVESHNSLRDDFEVSCPELDQLVEAAMEVDGVYGSRMTGGGFGGCTVTILKTDTVPAAIEHIKAHVSGSPTFYLCRPSDGARTLALSQ